MSRISKRKRALRRAAPCRKRRYAKQEHAKRVLAAMRAENGGCGSLHVYRCPVCEGFHIGHDKQWRKK